MARIIVFGVAYALLGICNGVLVWDATDSRLSHDTRVVCTTLATVWWPIVLLVYAIRLLPAVYRAVVGFVCAFARGCRELIGPLLSRMSRRRNSLPVATARKPK